MMTSAFIIVGFVLVAVLAFHTLDRWHRRWAWRNAERYAADYMRKVHGVERAPDGHWRDAITPKTGGVKVEGSTHGDDQHSGY